MNKKRICHYCKEEIKEGFFKVIVDGELVDAHKECYSKSLADKSHIHFKIR
jgi:hypothetical protein